MPPQDLYENEETTGGNALGEFSIGRIIREFRERWWLFAFVFLGLGGAIVSFMISREPVYTASATVQILRQSETRTQFAQVVDETLRSTEDVNTEVSIISSPLFVRRVARRVESEMKEAFLRPYLKPGMSEGDLLIDQIILDNREVVPIRLSLLLSIRYSHPQSEVAAKVADLFVDEITRYASEIRTDAILRASDDLREQAEIQRRKVEEIERELVEFKERTKSVSFDRQTDTDAKELLSLTDIVTRDRNEHDDARNQWLQIEAAEGDVERLLEIPIVGDDPRISRLVSFLADQRIKRVELEQRYREMHPKLVAVNQLIAGSESEVAAAVRQRVEGVRNRLLHAEANLRDSTALHEKKKEIIIQRQREQSIYDSLERELAVNTQLYQYFYNRIQETEAQNRDDVQRVRKIAAAVPPLEPSRPNLRNSVLLGGFVGAFGAFGCVFLAIVTDRRIKSQDQVERGLGLPILQTLPRLPRLPRRRRNLAALVGAARSDPRFAEAVHAIAALLRLNPASAGANALLVTSTVSGEGKSFCSALIAAGMAKLGDSVVLVEADLRGGSNGSLIADPGAPGIVGFFRDPALTLDDVVQRSEAIDADVVPSGGYSDSPYTIFCSSRFRALIAELAERYDRVIIDSPPVHLFGDALALLPHVDGTVFVVGFKKADGRLAAKSVDQLQAADRPVFGVIVNNVQNSRAATYFPNHYHRVKDYGGTRRPVAAPSK